MVFKLQRNVVRKIYLIKLILIEVGMGETETHTETETERERNMCVCGGGGIRIFKLIFNVFFFRLCCVHVRVLSLIHISEPTRPP